MYFMDDERLREYERFMQHTPHYRPRGCGVIGIRIMDTKPPPAPYEERMGQMAAHIPFQTSRMRLNQYLKESEGNPMIFKDGRHQAAFWTAIERVGQRDYGLLSALYLLTADPRLRRIVEKRHPGGTLLFEPFCVPGCTESAYTLYCAAKDLYLGTKHLTIDDLGDAKLIPTELFRLICNAMAVRRYGLRALEIGKEE